MKNFCPNCGTKISKINKTIFSMLKGIRIPDEVDLVGCSMCGTMEKRLNTIV